MTTVKKVKRKLNIKALILLLLIIYLIVMFSYTIINMKITNIYIKNTSLLTDNEIIEIAGIKDYPSIFKLNSKKTEESIAALELVNNVSIEKRINGSLIITVEEAKPLFYNRNNSKVELSNNKTVEANSKYLGIPSLINYVPSDLLKEFITAFSKVDSDIIKMINEIEYAPDINGDITIDAERFLLRMNDTNLVYVNIINMKRLNDYKEVYESIPENTFGTLYLDSYDSSNNVLGLFTPFEKDDNSSDNNSDDDKNQEPDADTGGDNNGQN